MHALLANMSHFGTTTLHPVAAAAFLALLVPLFLAPRRHALVPMLVLVCMIPAAQRVVPWSLDFSFLRLMIIVGWIRCLVRGEIWDWRWKRLDTMVAAWIVTAFATSTLLHLTFDRVILQAGLAFDAIGLFFFCRFVVRDADDLVAFARASALLAVPVAVLFCIEYQTGRNLFAAFGGVPEVTISRAGRLRCQGAFSHPILAGTFWASLMPLIAALLWQRPADRLIGAAGLLGAVVVVLACGSATPVNGMLLGACAAALFPFRSVMPWIRWTAVVAIIGLQMAMTNPLWHLLSRANVIATGSGWHRFKIVDSFIAHFSDWWLLGTPSYYHWWGTGLSDITNTYVQQGVNGGLITLALFGAIIVVSFAAVGRMIRRAERPTHRVVATLGSAADEPRKPAPHALPARATGTRAPAGTRPARRCPSIVMSWALGVMLFIHCTVFTSIVYFGQTIFIWYATLGLIASLAPSTRAVRRAVRAPHARASRLATT